MAGHSHAANIQYKKGANDAKKAKIFTKIAKDISIAAKSGLLDPELNQKLKLAIIKAKFYNMPKDKIEMAIEKANKDTTNYENIRYNAFFEKGISLIIEGLTDNKNRTASDIRGTLAKFDAQLASTGSVEYMYTHIGRILYEKNICNEERMFEVALDAGASDIQNDDEYYVIETSLENMIDVSKELVKTFGRDPRSAGWFWKANDYIDISNDAEFLDKFQKLFNAIDDIDDVTEVYTNATY